MTHPPFHRLIAFLLFLGAEVLYLATMAPTFSFWDCGEFIATAVTLGIPHPPGAPLYLLLGRLFAMIPFVSDIGARVNVISTLASSATVMLTYLITVRFITLYRKHPINEWSRSEQIAAYGGAAVGALALAFSDSFWFNAVEAEVYALSSLFTALVVWLMLRWHEEAPKAGNERWLLLVMYIIGLSIGVHLLSLLAVFAVALAYYFKKHQVTLVSFGWLVVVSLALFFLIYVVIIKGLPVLFQVASWWGLLAGLLLLCAAIWYSQRHRKAMMNTLLMSLLLLVIGYTSYGMIYVRAQANPPINENNPSTTESFYAYLNRDQYGDMPLFPRRWSPEPIHQYFYEQYSSDFDYFTRYQMQKMYLRYFGWQFIGREHDMEGAGVDWSVLWGLPFLVGLVGAISHFRRDWQMGVVVTALFVLTGAALVIYLNQTEPQPRERDYSYAGSFFAFALWIGIGVESLWQWLAGRMKASSEKLPVVALSVVGLALLLVDGRMLMANYRTHDRSGNYVSWDWAWNMLQSCERNAILFTNGDNDTFPLWYLQEVEGIRRDVRVVNLSLANTGWYLEQLKNSSPRGAKPVNFSMSDGELATISYMPIDSVDAILPSSTARRSLLRDTWRSGNNLPSAPLDTMVWPLKPGLTYDGQGYLRPQDLAVYDIVMSNFEDRPIYFALTVDPESMIGLDTFLRLDGLVCKVVPVKSSDPMSYTDPLILYQRLMQVYRYRNLANKHVYLEETSLRLSSNYTPLFVRLALELATQPEETLAVTDGNGVPRLVRRGALALQVLDSSERFMPLSRYPVNPELAASIIALYVQLGEKQKSSPYISYLEALSHTNSPLMEPRLFLILARAYYSLGREAEAKAIVQQLARELDQPELLKTFETTKK
uniref:DUF2723 domain-containing protein n=1 Tax=Chlorobium chlorochromatii (strain CaD3) TaxID=340177 RepID=Q3AU50_CHLCH